MVEAKESEGRVVSAPERRDDSRATIVLTVDYKRLNTFFADYTKNISKGGTFIRTAKPLEIGTEFMFVLTVPKPIPRDDADDDDEAAGPLRLELTGAVKWVVLESDATEKQPAGMGIQFIFKDAAEQATVEAFVTDLMRSSLGDHLADKLLSSR